jgi:uncharacterized membrane protein
MTIPQYFILYVLTVPVLIVGDLLWLGFIAKSFYQSRLGELLGPIQWYGAILFYVVYVAGIFIFVIIPALDRSSLQYALAFGALFGFFAYATYDLTNLATLKNWSLTLTFVDIVWGMFLTSIVACAGFLIADKLF